MQSDPAGFVVEPGNLWRRRVARRHLDRAPTLVSAGREAIFKCPTEPGLRLPARSVPWFEDPLASDDASLRTAAMDHAGIKSHVLYPTFAWSLFAIKDEALHLDCIRSYNDWNYDLCLASPLRFLRAIMVPMGRGGRAELERCVTGGVFPIKVRSAIICVEERTPVDELLQAAAAHAIPVVLLRSGGATPVSDPSAFSRESEELARRYANAGAEFVVLEQTGGSAMRSRPIGPA